MSMHALSEEGIVYYCNFSALAVAFKIKLALKNPHPQPIHPPHYQYFLLFPSPLFSLPFMAQQESLEKKRGFYSDTPCTPRHRQAFWNLSMPC